MKYFCFLLAFFFYTSAAAQLMGFKLPDGKSELEVPFKFQNNFILVELVFNQAFPLKFIFDTGSENTILVKKAFADILDVEYDRQFRIIGSDLKTELIAYLARGVNLDLPNMLGRKLDILVLEEDYFRFEEYTGIKIHGILGMDLFKTFTFKIDYKKKIITFYRIEDFKKPSKKFKEINLEVNRGKPYFTAQAKMRSDKTTNIKLLLDTGASMSLLLHNNSSEDIKLPEKLVPGRIGNGLGGFIDGYVGRINHLTFDDFHFSNIITNFQEIQDSSRIVFNFKRNGILGNEILSRFTVIFDLGRSQLYLRPRRRYNKGFKYDRSGITVITSGVKLENFIIKDVIPNSPAGEAGLQIGDRIVNINFTPSAFYNLKNITNILQKRVGKRIRLIVERNGKRHKFKFRLRDLI